jgi:hypothetical protein
LAALPYCLDGHYHFSTIRHRREPPQFTEREREGLAEAIPRDLFKRGGLGRSGKTVAPEGSSATRNVVGRPSSVARLAW